MQAPNGIISHIFGPIEGSRHYAFMLRVSGLMEKLERIRKFREPYVIYGDPAYGLTTNILAPFKGNDLNADERAFNRDMNSEGVSGVGFWQDITDFCLFGFQKESEIAI